MIYLNFEEKAIYFDDLEHKEDMHIFSELRRLTNSSVSFTSFTEINPYGNRINPYGNTSEDYESHRYRTDMLSMIKSSKEYSKWDIEHGILYFDSHTTDEMLFLFGDQIVALRAYLEDDNVSPIKDIFDERKFRAIVGTYGIEVPKRPLTRCRDVLFSYFVKEFIDATYWENYISLITGESVYPQDLFNFKLNSKIQKVVRNVGAMYYKLLYDLLAGNVEYLDGALTPREEADQIRKEREQKKKGKRNKKK